jgi:GDP-L-fucose synthase
MSQRILVTGGTGMVGRALRREPTLARQDLLAPTREELDLRDAAAVQRYMQRARPDLVVHAAGKVGGIAANMAAPVAFLVENLDIGRNVILGAHKAGVKRLLNLSSSCVYPRDAPNPLREESILRGELEPTNEGYALAKIAALRLCQYIAAEDATRSYKTFVPCNLYGPHDKFDPRSAHLIPALLDRLHRAKEEGAPAVSMWGDGTARREFMFVDDLARAVAKAAGDFAAVPRLMNVGLGTDLAVADYYRAVADCVGYRGRFEHDLSKPVGMQRKVVDVSRQEAWGWRPTTTLADGLRKTYEHYLAGVPA